MCQTHSINRLTVNAVLKTDPTRTATLRRRFEGEAGRRFRKLAQRIRKLIVDEDAFGLKQIKRNAGRFEFLTSEDKVSEFMRWLQDAQREEILEVYEGTPIASAGRRNWMSTYLQTAYKAGVIRSASTMRGVGATVSQRWIDSAFNRPIHADRVGLIYTRAYSELKGITEEMDRQISRILAGGIANGDNPEVIARNLTNRVMKIGRTRARTLARTEVINAHAEATLNGFTEAGINEVEVEAEFATADDDLVCPVCESLEGNTYTIQESRGIIPVHPNCRCAWLPKVINGTGIELL